MLPEFNTISSKAFQGGKSFLFDFEKNDFVLRDGKFVVIYGVDVVKQWVQFTLRTERFKYLIYQDHGVEVRELIANLPQKLLFVEIPRTIREALEVHEQIQSVGNFTFERLGSTLKIFFSVKLIDGNLFGGDFIVRTAE